jgi:hypothetical protein
MHRWVWLVVMLVISQAGKSDAAVIDFDGAPATTPLFYGDFTFSATTPASAGRTLAANVTGNNGTNAFAFSAGNTVTVTYTGLGTFTLNSLALGRTTSSVSDPTFTITGSGPGVNFGPFATLTPTAFGATFSNITSLVIAATQEAAFDNFDYTINGAAAVPEPASAAFLGLGSLALVVRRLRRRNSVVA